MKRRFTIRKYLGDDRYSWALFENGRPVMTGLSRTEARWERDKANANAKEKTR